MRPDVLLTTKNGRRIAIEITYKNPKSPKYKQIYRELKIHAVEVFVNYMGIQDMKIIYSYGEETYFPKQMIRKMEEHKEQATGFIREIYKQAERWERKNLFKPDVPRWVYRIKEKDASRDSEGFLFFTTRKTFTQVFQSYGHLFQIFPCKGLKRVLLKRDLGLFDQLK